MIPTFLLSLVTSSASTALQNTRYSWHSSASPLPPRARARTRARGGRWLDDGRSLLQWTLTEGRAVGRAHGSAGASWRVDGARARVHERVASRFLAGGRRPWRLRDSAGWQRPTGCPGQFANQPASQPARAGLRCSVVRA